MNRTLRSRRWITTAMMLLLVASSRLPVSLAHEPTAAPVDPAPLAADPLVAVDRLVQYACAGAAGDDPAYAVTKELCSMALHTVQLVNDAGEPIAMRVLVAADHRQRGAGYQHIGPAVIAETAILFVSSLDDRAPFHMCNVSSPLDIAWFRSDGTLLDLQRMEPGRSGYINCSPNYLPRTAEPYRFVLEAAAGRLDTLGLAPGGRLIVESIPGH